jgi:protein-disulfide isomerase
VEFSDFHCPFCKKVQPTLTEVLSRYPDKVKLVYRAAPIDSLHPHAREAAGAVKCAHEQGRFWAYHDKLYARESDASLEH